MEAGVIEVRMRLESEWSSKPVTTWPIKDLDSLIPELERWGNPDGSDLSGQMNKDRTGVWFFEVVVHDGDG